MLGFTASSTTTMFVSLSGCLNLACPRDGQLISSYTACSQPGGKDCQNTIFSIEGPQSRNINIYNLNTIGSTSMIDQDGVSLAKSQDNINVFPDTIAVFGSGGSSNAKRPTYGSAHPKAMKRVGESNSAFSWWK